MSNEPIHRRSFAARSTGALLWACLLQHSARGQALGGTLKWSVRPWLQRLDDASAALASARIGPRAWQREVEDTLARFELPDLLRSLDFEALAAPDRGFPADNRRRRP